jgi:hypothetical protein
MTMVTLTEMIVVVLRGAAETILPVAVTKSRPFLSCDAYC